MKKLMMCAVVMAAACGPQGGLPSLGGGSHDLSKVEFTPVLTRDEGLQAPTDLAMNPDRPGQLWVVNRKFEGMVVADNVLGAPSDIEKFDENLSGIHFMARPTGIDFGDSGFFATAHDQDQVTEPQAPGTFMGPTLWTSDLDEFDAGHGSHYDMLHNSPNSVGIAWETGNAYWVYDGFHGALTRYDFNEDHGPGGSDHTDGIVRRYLDGEMGYRTKVPHNLALDHATDTLYAADASNGRIVALDITSGTEGDAIEPNFDGSDQRFMDGAELQVAVTAEELTLTTPSGLALYDGLLIVGDFVSGRIVAWDLALGELVDWVDTGVDDMGGLIVTDEGTILFTDIKDNVVYRLAAPTD